MDVNEYPHYLSDGYLHGFSLIQCGFCQYNHVLDDIGPFNEVLLCVPVDGVSDPFLIDHSIILAVHNVIYQIQRFPSKCDDFKLTSLVDYIYKVIVLPVVDDGYVQ